MNKRANRSRVLGGMLCLLTLVASAAFAGGNLGHVGSFPKWSKIEIVLTGPDSVGSSNSPNPFGIPVDVNFQSPSGGSFTVPAFYDGNGNGGMNGDVWRVRFSAPETGSWSFVSDSTNSTLNNYTGSFTVTGVPPNAPPFEQSGRLQYAGGHYLKFADGGYWIKGGADDPEDFLAPGVMGNWTGKKAAVDYLASKGVNSMYIMLQNVNGDGDNVWPWVSDTDSDHFDLAKLKNWDDLFDHIQDAGIVLHLVLEDDSGWTGFNRDFYYREMIARFGHYNAVIWNISEEYNENYSSNQIKVFAQQIRDRDAYDHPITVHHAGGRANWNPFVGDNRFDLTSFQTAKTPRNDESITWRNTTASSGRPIPISFDETGKIASTERGLARQIVWSIYMGGGIFEMHTWPLNTFQDFEDHWNDMRRARLFLEALPFWQMAPDNDLIVGGSGNRYCLAKPGEVYVVYLEDGGQVSLDLTGEAGTFEVTWFNPRNGDTSDGGLISAGDLQPLGAPPFSNDVAVKIVSTTLSEQFSLTVTRLGTGSGRVTSAPAGINCGIDCAESYAEGTQVVLTATPDSGSNFNGWGGDNDCVDGQLTLDRNLDCTATFSDDSSNQPPLADDQTTTTVQNTPVDIVLTYTDNDGPGPYTYTLLTQPTRGDLSGTPPNLTYAPDPGFLGSDGFDWLVHDGLDDSNVATVDLLVQLNQAPIASDFSISVPAGGSVDFSLSPHIEDNDGPGPLTTSIVTQPDHGDLTGSNNDWTYAANSGFSGIDSFTWQAHDGLESSNIATTTVFVEESLFEDQFDRPDSENLDNGWIEIESQSQTYLASNTVDFDAADDSYRPMIVQTVTSVSAGTLTWSFDINFDRTGSENRYSFWMQLGDSATMDENQPTQNGVAVNLIWGGPDAGLDAHEGLGYVVNGTVTQIATVSGLHAVQIQADLDLQVYSVSVAGQTVEDIPFDASPVIDSIRYFTHILNANSFSSRALDNVVLEAQGGSLLFSNGFESGDLSAWSRSVN